MPLKVTDLQPGDRVMLNCPKSRVMVKRVAEFEGCYGSVDDVMAKHGEVAVIVGSGTIEFLKSGDGLWAGFLFGSSEWGDFRAAFKVEPDGSLRDEEGRRIYVERRLGRVQTG